MTRLPVNSSMILSIGWEDEVLEVEFNNQKVFRYDGVPQDVFIALKTSTSVGKEFNRLVKNKYQVI